MKTLISGFILFLLIHSAHAQKETDIHEQFTSKYISVDGYSINIEVKGSGEAIFFFAGGPGNSHDYMQGAFGQYYKTNKVVFIDMLG